MKKKVILIVLILIIVAAVFIGYLLQRESEISKLPDYYQDLAEECKKSKELGISRSSSNCCLESVKTMAEGNFRLPYSPYPGEVNPKPECLEGFGVNRLRCEGSYDWCEPIEEYYQELAKECVSKGAGFECCMTGLDRMIKYNFKLADEDGNCLEGFRSNGLYCIDTLTWCEPIEE